MTNRTIFIAANKSGRVSRVSFNLQENTCKPLFSDSDKSIAKVGETSTTRINALATLVHTLNQLQAQKVEGKLPANEIVTIYAPGVLVDCIHMGTFKHWLANNGKKADGSNLSAEEISFWERFVPVYTDLFLNVNLQNIKKATNADQVRVSGEKAAERKARLDIARKIKSMAGRAWEMVGDDDEVNVIEDGDEAEAI